MKSAASVRLSLPPPVLPDTLEKAHQVILENHELTVKLFSLVEALQADQVDEVKHYYPDTTCACGGQCILEEAPSRRRQVFDLPEVRYPVTEHQSYAGACERRGKRQVARLPDL